MPDGKILIISHNSPSYDYGKCLAKHVEYSVEQNALAKISDLDPDLAIIDCGFITDKCVEFLKNIKRIRTGLPVIFVTDASTEELVIKVFKNGARDYFKKPVNLDELRNTIDSILLLKQESLEERDSPATFGKRGALENHRQCSKIPENILHALDYIAKNLSSPLVLDKIAGEACISKFHFCREFKKHIGMSPMQFAINERISKAKALLKSKDLPIAVIALKAGFEDLTEFNRHFKKLTGFSPSEFRKSAK